MTASSDKAMPPRSNTMLWWGAAGAALLMVAGGAAFFYASKVAVRPSGSDAVTVTLRDGTCQPNELTVPAGRATFQIVNATDRAVEWEILDGVMVVEERENIAPGLSQTLGARLRAGQYAITCGLLSNPRGTLTVTPSAASGDGNRPALKAFIGPLAEDQVFLAMQGNAVVKTATALDDAIRAGSIEDAKALYTAARAPYLRLAPVAGRFADLDNAIDPVATYLEKREEDPAFTGFHRIEYGLFARNSLDGLAPVSAKLVSDATALKDRLRATKLTPSDMGDGAVRVLSLIAGTRLSSGEELYAKSDLSDLDAQIAGIRKIVALLKPVASQSAPDDARSVDTALASLDDQMASLKTDGAYPAFDTLGADAKSQLSAKVAALGAAIDRMNQSVGFGQDGA